MNDADVRRLALAQLSVPQSAVSVYGGLNRLLQVVQNESKAVRDWEDNPMTRLFLDALLPLSLNPEAALPDTGNPLIQYGITSGVSLSHQLLSDPVTFFRKIGIETDHEAAQAALETQPDFNIPATYEGPRVGGVMEDDHLGPGVFASPDAQPV